jgi:hypothetical protein
MEDPEYAQAQMIVTPLAAFSSAFLIARDQINEENLWRMVQK